MIDKLSFQVFLIFISPMKTEKYFRIGSLNVKLM